MKDATILYNKKLFSNCFPSTKTFFTEQMKAWNFQIVFPTDSQKLSKNNFVDLVGFLGGNSQNFLCKF